MRDDFFRKRQITTIPLRGPFYRVSSMYRAIEQLFVGIKCLTKVVLAYDMVEPPVWFLVCLVSDTWISIKPASCFLPPAPSSLSFIYHQCIGLVNIDVVMCGRSRPLSRPDGAVIVPVSVNAVPSHHYKLGGHRTPAGREAMTHSPLSQSTTATSVHGNADEERRMQTPCI